MSAPVNLDPWTKIGVIAAVLMVVLGVPAFLLDLGSLRGGGEPTPRPPVATTPAHEERRAPTGTPHPTPGACVTVGGEEIGCGQAGSLYVVHVSECTSDAARQALAVPAILQLNLHAVPVGSACAVGAGDLAADYDVTGQDIAELPAGRPLSALVECSSDTGASVSCAAPHRIEPVTGWAPATGTDEQQCVDAVRSYVGRTGGLHDPLTASVQQGDSDGVAVTRCVVTSSLTLTGSVYGIGGAALPTP